MRPWLSDWLSVSTSFVMRESTSPFGMVPPSKYKSGTRDLSRNLPAHAVHDLLRDAGHDPALHARRRGARQAYAQQANKYATNLAKVYAAGAGRGRLRAADDLRRGAAKDLRSHDREEHARHRKRHRGDEPHAVGTHVVQELANGAAKVLGLLARRRPCRTRRCCRCCPRTGSPAAARSPRESAGRPATSAACPRRRA